MSGVGRGRGAVMPAWMKAKGLDAAPAPGAAAQGATPAVSPKQNQMPANGSKRTFDSVNDNHVPATAAAAAVATTTTTITTSLPPGWHESFDTKYQRSYYYNYSTGERTWIKPEWQQQQPETVPAAAPAAVQNASSLPASARWEKAIDPARGKPYYYNHATGESAWALPEGATLLQHAVPAVKKQRGEAEEEEVEEGEVDVTSDPNKTTTAVSHAPIAVDKARETTTVPVDGVEKEKNEKEKVLSSSSSPLPPGWSSAEDPGTGRTYFYNQTLKITQWHHPNSNPAPSPATVDAARRNEQHLRETGRTAPTTAGRGGGNATRRQQAGTRNEPLDPMDPSSYSDTPRGGWGAGLGKETAM